jgi:8-oxo-dGTP diphosphatase
LKEEAGAQVIELGSLAGVYSDPNRDPRFHAVTVVVHAQVDGELQGPENPVEVREARFFAQQELPSDLSHGTGDMLKNAMDAHLVWE